MSIQDDLIRAAKLVMKEIEANAEPDYGKPLSDEENPWHEDYYRLKNAVEAAEGSIPQGLPVQNPGPS